MFRRGARRTPSSDEERAERAYLQRGRTAHRRDLRWKIVGPVLICGMVILFVSLLITLVFAAGRLGTIADFMALFIFVPLSLLCFITYFVLVVMLFGMAKVYGKSTTVLRSLYNTAHRMNVGMRALSPRIAAPVIRFNVWLARWERLIAIRLPGLFPASEITAEQEADD